MSINVLCFGDSLTKGYCNDGDKYYPYCYNLEKYLNTTDYSLHFKLFEHGKDGECVINMIERFRNLINENTFDIVILFGGINDLGQNIEVNKIGQSFDKIYKIIDNSRVNKFIHITIPFNRLDTFQSEKYNKDKINEIIKNDLFSHKRIILDINNHEKFSFNYLTLDDYYKQLYWDDVIHYSQTGYDVLAKCIFKCFIDNTMITFNFHLSFPE